MIQYSFTISQCIICTFYLMLVHKHANQTINQCTLITITQIHMGWSNSIRVHSDAKEALIRPVMNTIGDKFSTYLEKNNEWRWVSCVFPLFF